MRFKDLAISEGEFGIIEVCQVPASECGIIFCGDGGHQSGGGSGIGYEGVGESTD